MRSECIHFMDARKGAYQTNIHIRGPKMVNFVLYNNILCSRGPRMRLRNAPCM